ncbi:hypothetical protein ACILD6_00170 [Capnocytophaga canimorsus]|uniref:hypothetical protein n=1 Tax=Capnocytophaga canimorsus TaxID=28188 RepID=UPI0037D988CA
MAEKFCKIFEKDGQQVLIKKNYDKVPILEFTTWVEGNLETFKFSYPTTEYANEIFDKINEDKVEEFLEFVNN